MASKKRRGSCPASYTFTPPQAMEGSLSVMTLGLRITTRSVIDRAVHMLNS